MLSGVKAQVGIKLYGDDLTILRQKAKEIEAAIQGVPGVKRSERRTQQNEIRICKSPSIARRSRGWD